MALFVVIILAAVSASATPLAPSKPVLVNARYSYGDCVGRFDVPPGDTVSPLTRMYEAEPHLAVNPRKPRNLIAGWIQDRGTGGRLNGLASSFDGGKTWTEVVPSPGLTGCQQSPYLAEGQSDPWVVFGRDGIAYLGSSNGFHVGVTTLQTTAVTVATSGDGGRTWTHWRDLADPASSPDRAAVSGPVAPVVGPADFNDKPVIAPDPFADRTAYVTWFRLHWAPPLMTELFFAKTTDGGRTWSPPARIGNPQLPPDALTSPYVSVIPYPNGPGRRLVLTYTRTTIDENLNAGPGAFYSVVSDDLGASWTTDRPVLLGDYVAGQGVRDPETNNLVRFPAGFQIQVVDASGSIRMVWADNHCFRADLPARTCADGRHNAIQMVTSTDGVNWSAPSIVVERDGAMVGLPMVAAHPDGTLGLSWYDMRRDQKGDGQLTTDYWFAHSHDRGATWQEEHVAGPFDLRPAFAKVDGLSPTNFIGDYSGLVAIEDGFAAAFALTNAKSDRPSRGVTDIFFTKLTP